MCELDILALLESIQVFERKLNLALMYWGLRLPQYRVLDLLDKSGKITVSDISRKLSVTCATMSVLVAKMKDAGLIESLDNKKDKRSFYVKLTEAGYARFRSAEQTVLVIQRGVCKSLSAETVAAINSFSRDMVHGRIPPDLGRL